ncbi:putative glutamine amidotransferase-like protein-like protein [Hapsidospora chrysogenum ATCC 11550]|uniref:Putative glutamine amidotransferase-like protein-like protein n=1 Tax=Hapsidospora chrysogenum (strain ATCC 11550 / CBS 779.69 / DSM 880 / IAM 14645 / JCM 23072 / IMI 49137) TaxID=857340 RepID=A0A086T5Z9_HAPC1|nr:putative glutamine amidotransferase-like protein-like protein [Hapsidospora chrysogenum ATCC 11550]
MRKYRLAILECDTPVEAVLEKLGTYGTIYDAFARRGLKAYVQDGGRSDIDLEVTTWNMVDMGALPPLGQVDGLMLTGSKHNAFDDDPWILRLVDYVREAYESKNVTLVGICFGHQIIARALGGQVERNAGAWEVSVDQVDLTPEGQKVFGVEKIHLHHMHQDIVKTLPEGAVNLGRSPVCEIQGLYIPRRAITVQAHPEFNDFIMSSILRKRHGQGIFPDDVYESGMARAEKQHDGLHVCKTFWRFMLDEL